MKKHSTATEAAAAPGKEKRNAVIAGEASAFGNPALSAHSYGKEALETLLDVARNGSTDAARVSAANALLDRAFGKPGLPLDLSGLSGSQCAAAPEQAELSPAVAALLTDLRGERG